jgi:hypothetical protein
MAAKKCKCGRKLVLEMDKVRGKCFHCATKEVRARTAHLGHGGKGGSGKGDD